MVAVPVADDIRNLASLVAAGGVAVLSGAGISTESGIPDYRGDGRRLRHTPMTYLDFASSGEGRRRYWARSHSGWRRIARATPNAAHHAVADLESDGLVHSVITQNVDGLHSAAGSRRVLELHGSLARTVCLDCGDRRSRLELHHRLEAANPDFERLHVEMAPDGDARLPDSLVERFVVVDCLSCGGRLKPDVVFFGENVPRDRVDVAYRWVSEASTLLVLGSSLTVMSGYRFVLAAHRAGTPIAIVNRGPTRGDAQATIRIDANLCEVLTRFRA
ncbi:MAG TPA: NAD-dependent protein deacetylase [Acidimicrobiia bacterium]|nr:NAD-dependent protein deacetylase [Acidimicrobiia bacterium]